MIHIRNLLLVKAFSSFKQKHIFGHVCAFFNGNPVLLRHVRKCREREEKYKTRVPGQTADVILIVRGRSKKKRRIVISSDISTVLRYVCINYISFIKETVFQLEAFLHFLFLFVTPYLQ